MTFTDPGFRLGAVIRRKISGEVRTREQRSEQAWALARQSRAGVRNFMAFGFGFNKQKVLSAAEKFVQQGKLQNAIAEYEKVTKHDPKDLTVTNTIGDLYARLGDVLKAVDCFKNVGDAYASQGFTVKGIAMYKKITKLQPSVDGSLKLAELYTQQGLFNDARAQYLQVAEDFMKNGELEQAVRLFQKVLEMDPENVPMRVKLAEVYIRLGKKKDAWEIFSAAAESLRSKGQLAAAEDILQRMLSLDPGNSYALLLRGRAALENDDPQKAVQYLEKAADLDSHPEGLRDLLKAYLQTGQLAQAAPLAAKLLAVHNESEGLFLLAEGYNHAGQYAQALDVFNHNADRLLAADSTKLMSSLHSLITHLRGDPASLDALLQLLNKAGESTHVGEVTELLAHASVQSGNLLRARDLYEMLSTMEPQNPLHLQNYQQVVARMQAAAPSKLITAEEGSVIVDELEATAPVIDQSYCDVVTVAVRSAITDADLFLSYNLPDKAIVPLLGALPEAPRDVRLNQRLAALHTRSQRFTEAAVCCRTLEGVYSEAGYPDEALRYGELAARYEDLAPPSELERAASAPVAPVAPWPLAPPDDPQLHAALAPTAEVEPGRQEQPEFAVEVSATPLDSESVDLSSEWDNSATVEAVPANEGGGADDKPVRREVEDPANNPEIAEILEEARFYLEHSMTDQARAALARIEALTSERSILDPLRAQIEAASQQSSSEADAVEITIEEPEAFAVEVEGQDAEAPAVAEALVGYHDTTEPDHAPHAHAEPVAEIHEEVQEPAHTDAHAIEAQPAEAHAEVHEEPEPQSAHAQHDQGPADLASFVADLESSLGDAFPEVPATPEPASKPLPAWPMAAAPESSEAKAVPEPESAVAHSEGVADPAAPAPPLAAAASAAAGTPNSGGLSYGPAPVRPLGAGAQAMVPADSVDLSQMFGELKQELEETSGPGDDDPETHYNLGVAFREMGLLDEAIAELQKVCTSVERGHHFSQLVQTYTWLAQCFLDKGVPDAAIRWYEKALTIPNLDTEARTAIHYELGAACETAQDKAAALSHFTQAYGANIDYRDVSERIQALKS